MPPSQRPGGEEPTGTPGPHGHEHHPGIVRRGIVQWVHELGPAGPLTVLVTILPGVGGLVLLGLLTAVAPWLRAHVAIGLPLYCVGFWLLGGLALLPTYANSGLGGWTFGWALGFPAAMVGLSGAAVVGYILSRRASGDRVAQLIENSSRARAIYQRLIGCGFWKALLVICLIRIPPVPPFAATNLLLAAARVPLRVFIAGTILGIAPRTALVVYLFSRLETLDFRSAHQLRWFAGQLVVTAAVLSVISYLAHRAVSQVTAPAPSSLPPSDGTARS